MLVKIYHNGQVFQLQICMNKHTSTCCITAIES
uniref:Uncharacterized protein n=1 Tax=Rhizophora mucronata TaxID=61149 RepID=A0A2P2QXU2_RHIMU